MDVRGTRFPECQSSRTQWRRFGKNFRSSEHFGDNPMIKPTSLADSVKPVEFIKAAMNAVTSSDIEDLLSQLPICPEDQYAFDEEHPDRGWQEGKLHWVPVGAERGNAGRIKTVNQPVNPTAERAINGMEAIIELARQRELARDPLVPAPPSPRDAVRR